MMAKVLRRLISSTKLDMISSIRLFIHKHRRGYGGKGKRIKASKTVIFSQTNLFYRSILAQEKERNFFVYKQVGITEYYDIFNIIYSFYPIPPNSNISFDTAEDFISIRNSS